MCHTFGQRPSDVMKELLGNEVPLNVRPIDWYTFDITAASQVHALYNKAHDDPGTSSPVLKENGNEITIRGTEIPPWER